MTTSERSRRSAAGDVFTGAAPDSAEGRDRQLGEDLWHVLVLVCLALTAPLLRILTGHAHFFVDRHSPPVDILLLLLAVSVLLPGVLVALELLLNLISIRLRRLVHGLVLATLLTCWLLVSCSKPLPLPWKPLVGGVLVLALILSLMIARSHLLRTILSGMVPVLLLFPLWFLFLSPVAPLVTGRGTTTKPAPIEATAPVVILIFDELPLVSLLDHRRQVDPVRFPNFAALAENSTWFREATTVHPWTSNAVPAILTGRFPASKQEGEKLAVATEYPDSIFTLLGGSYRMKVIESKTQICPPSLCGPPLLAAPLGERMLALLSDSVILYLHALLPPALERELPSIEDRWGGFSHPVKQFLRERSSERQQQLSEPERSVFLFQRFLESLEPAEGPSLFLHHTWLPHAPWVLLPSGRRHDPQYDQQGTGSREEEWGMMARYQIHQLQLAYADRLLGQTLSRLRESGLFDRCLLVVTADHGIAFEPGVEHRGVNQQNYPEILPVPLFIKRPGQRRGEVSDRNVLTIDILPTIAEVLKINPPWTFEGRSTWDESAPARTEKTARNLALELFTVEPRIEKKYAVLKQRLAWLNSTEQSAGFYRLGPYGALVGTPVGSYQVTDATGFAVEFDQHDWFQEAIDTDAYLLPARVSGGWLTTETSPGRIDLAVAVNGSIQAVTGLYADRGREYQAKALRFSVAFDESALQPGRNQVEFFWIQKGDDGGITLARIPQTSTPISHWTHPFYDPWSRARKGSDPR